MGVLSLIFWSLIIIVTIKYVFLVMRADNRGEGGILALMALAQRVSVGRRRKKRAISPCRYRRRLPVLRRRSDYTGDIGAVSRRRPGGVRTRAEVLYVLPISISGDRDALFAMQYKGTGSVGRVFGPIMVVWFFIIGVTGLAEIIPASIRAAGGFTDLRSSNSVYPIQRNGIFRPRRRGAVRDRSRGTVCRHGSFRCETDPSSAWLVFVLPCPDHELLWPGRADDPRSRRPSRTRFSCWALHWLRLPMVILATAATVIASQAVNLRVRSPWHGSACSWASCRA